MFGFLKKFGVPLFSQTPFLVCSVWVLPREWTKIKQAFICWRLYFPVWKTIFLSFFLSLALSLTYPPIIHQVNLFKQREEIGLLTNFFLTVIVAPISKECFFRQLIFANFEKNQWTPYFLSFFGFILAQFPQLALLSSLVEVSSLVIYYALLAHFLIYLYQISNWNLAFPLVFHCLNNFLALVINFTLF